MHAPGHAPVVAQRQYPISEILLFGGQAPDRRFHFQPRYAASRQCDDQVWRAWSESFLLECDGHALLAQAAVWDCNDLKFGPERELEVVDQSRLDCVL